MKRVLLLLIFVALALSACGGEPSPSPSPSPLQNQAIVEPTNTTPPALPTPETSLPDGTAPGVIAGTTPGVIAGRVTDEAGNPLTNAHVTIWGTTGAGANTYFEAAVDEAGRYVQPVPRGVYEIKAYAGIEYNDRHYNIWLHPVDGIDTPSQDAANGLAKDFVLRTSGPKPSAKTAPKKPDSHYGGVIDVADEGQYYMFYGNGQLVEPFIYPEGAVVRVELTPNGPLLDGSTGEVVVRELKGEEVATAAIVDVPLGDYAVRAAMIETDGTTTPLLVASYIPGGPFGEKIVPAESARAEFVPSRMGDYGFEPVELFIIPE
jgi:hypothetical protein